MVKSENYYVVHGWMLDELNLRGNELAVYAIIYGFSQTENQFFVGSHQYLADWTNSTKRNVIRNLNSLLEKGLLQKKEQFVDGVKYVHYRAIRNKMSSEVTICHWGGDKLSFDVVTICRLSDDNLSSATIYNIDNNINNNITSSAAKSDGDSGSSDIPKTENNLQKECQQSSQGVSTKFTGGCQQSLHPTINNKISDNITSSAAESGGGSGSSDIPKNGNNIKEDSKTSEQKEKIPYAEILKLYNEICKSLPKALKLSEKRRNIIRKRLHDGYSMDDIKQAFELAEKSPFLRGEINKSFHADFDWIFQSDHILRILENKYKDRNEQNQYTNPPQVSIEGHNEEFLRLNGLIP